MCKHLSRSVCDPVRVRKETVLAHHQALPEGLTVDSVLEGLPCYFHFADKKIQLSQLPPEVGCRAGGQQYSFMS